MQRKVENDPELSKRVKSLCSTLREALDHSRERIPDVFFMDKEVSLTWNGHHVVGAEDIRKFLKALPKTNHVYIDVDSQFLNLPDPYRGWVLATVVGNVKIDVLKHLFQQTMILIPHDGGYQLKDLQYRFIA